MHESTRVPRPCACTTVRRVSRVLARAFDAALKPSGLNVTQLAVLRAVQRRRGEPLMHVARDLCMDRTSLYRAVSRMALSFPESLSEDRVWPRALVS
jgi:DNA-binding phage protein